MVIKKSAQTDSTGILLKEAQVLLVSRGSCGDQSRCASEDEMESITSHHFNPI